MHKVSVGLTLRIGFLCGKMLEILERLGTFIKEIIPEKALKKYWITILMIFISIVIIVAIMTFPKIGVYVLGIDWTYNYNEETEQAVFKTDTELKNSNIIVSPRIEVKYKGRIVYILEIHGLYNINSASFQFQKLDTEGDENEGTELRLIIETQQMEYYDLFYEEWGNLLQEYWEEEGGEGDGTEDLEIRRQQIAHIDYQMFNSNKSDSMYLCISDNEIRTITKDEARLKSKIREIDLDEINFEESFYVDKTIRDLVGECIQSTKG